VSAVAVASRARAVAALADLLEYPSPGLPDAIRRVRAAADGVPAATALLDRFAADVDALPPGRLEELYSAAFDLSTPSSVDATCYPYVGHHLFGESYRRSRFMVGLLERYAAEGFEVEGAELPDHVVVLLRFLATDPDPELAAELVGDALLPALGRMTLKGEEAALEGESGRRIWLRALEAVRLVLRDALWPDVTVASYDDVEPPAADAGERSVCG
jgi:nitrate reductase molybdenum cofactor assembly chaperone